MHRIRPTHLVAVAAAALVVAAPAFAAPKGATLTIHHQTHGCHSWSFSATGPWRSTQAITLARKSTLTVIDNDVMPHALYQLSGPTVKLTTPAMKKMGARATVVFAKAGTYVFGTKAGEDYMKGITTTGPDNVLRLRVTVK